MKPLERFALAVLEESRESLGDLDGGWLQDKAVDLGVLVVVNADEPCGENCGCVEYADWPIECYRYSPETVAALAESKLPDTREVQLDQSDRPLKNYEAGGAYVNVGSQHQQDTPGEARSVLTEFHDFRDYPQRDRPDWDLDCCGNPLRPGT